MSKSTTTTCASRKYADDSTLSKLASIVEPMFNSTLLSRHLIQPTWPAGIHPLIHQVNGSPPLRSWINTMATNQHVTAPVAFPTTLPQPRLINDDTNLQGTNNQMMMDHWEAWRQIHQVALSNNISPHFLALCQSTGYPPDFPNAPRRKNATRETTSILKAWLNQHKKNPYPTKGEKIMLALITKMTLTQVSTWFANARRRLKKENKMTWTARTRNEDDLEDHCDDDDDEDDDEEAGVYDDDEPNTEQKADERLLNPEPVAHKINQIWSIADIANEESVSSNSKNKIPVPNFPMSFKSLRASTALHQYSDHIKMMQNMSQIAYRNMMRSWSNVGLSNVNSASSVLQPPLNLTNNNNNNNNSDGTRKLEKVNSVSTDGIAVVLSPITFKNSRSSPSN